MSADEQKHAGKETTAVDLLSDEALDSVSIKALRVAYRELRDAFKTHDCAAVAKAALRDLRARGMKTGGDVPYGYRCAEGVKPEDKRVLIPDEKEQEAIALAKHLRAKGETLRAIARALHKKGIRTREKSRFDPKQISRMLEATAADPMR